MDVNVIFIIEPTSWYPVTEAVNVSDGFINTGYFSSFINKSIIEFIEVPLNTWPSDIPPTDLSDTPEYVPPIKEFI